MNQEHPHRCSRIYLFSFLLFSILFIFQECLFRLIFPIPEIVNFDRISYSVIADGDVAKSSKRPVRLSNASYTLSSQPDGIEFTHWLNLYGFRDRDWTVEKTLPRWGFVGDSFVEGFMAERDETISVTFEACAIRDGLPVEAMNFGIGGVGFESYVRLLHDAVPLFDLDAVFLVLYANDLPGLPFDEAWLQDGPSPRFSSRWVPRAFDVIREFLRTGFAVKRWHSRPFPFCAAVPDSANPLTDHAHLISPTVDPVLVEAMKMGAFNPYQYNYLILLEENLKIPVRVEPHLRHLNVYLNEHRCQLYVAYLPCRHQVSDGYIEFAKRCTEPTEITSLMAPPYDTQNKTLKTVCSQLGIPFIDLTPGLIEREKAGQRMFWDYDSHMRGEGYTYTGERLYDFARTGK